MRTIRTNILYGMVALIPIAALILIGYYIYDLWTALLEPMSNSIGLTDAQSRLAAVGLALGALLVICFVVGTIVRTRIGGWMFSTAESSLLKHIPGYELIATMLRGFADDRATYQPAIIELAGSGVGTLGFIMEDTGGPTLTVFIPSAPVVTVGRIHVVARSRVKPLAGSSLDAANALSQWGIGLQALMDQTEQTKGPVV